MANSRGARIVLAAPAFPDSPRPFAAIAHELKRRGHRPVVATGTCFRSYIETQGIEFAAMRPDGHGDGDRTLDSILDPVRGEEYLIRELLMPNLQAMFDDADAACAGADLVVSGPYAVAAPVAAERNGIPWASAVLSPRALRSRYDRSVLSFAPRIDQYPILGRRLYGAALKRARRQAMNWSGPVQDLRESVGLNRASNNPLFEGQFSPHLNLALFSRVIGWPQPDWPINTFPTGFPRSDTDGLALPRELTEFLDAGEPPVLFVSGAAGEMDIAQNVEASAAAARRVCRRAVFLRNSARQERPSAGSSGSMVFVSSTPHSELFRRSALIVHHGDIAATAETLRAGRPALVVPRGLDEPDNAYRVCRLGAAMSIPASACSGSSLAEAMEAMLSTTAYEEAAAEAREQIGEVDGASAAADAIEELLSD